VCIYIYIYTYIYIYIYIDRYSVTPPLPTQVMFGLLLFNAVILERKKFGPLGWNIQYQFTDGDTDATLRQAEVHKQALVCLSNREIMDASRGRTCHCLMANNRIMTVFF